MLHTILTGPVPDQPSLLIAHGLYGSARNWSTIAKRLSDSRRVLTVDMRNHGASFFHASNDYPDLAGDLAEVIAAHGGPMDVLGHSMGGKAAMMLALTAPELVNRLIVGDIAPVAYEHTQVQYIHAMRQVDLGKLTARRDADAAMKSSVPEDDIRTFLLQSLDVKEKRWRLNLDALEAEMPRIMGFPKMRNRFEGSVLFLSGDTSNYVAQGHRNNIKALFPSAKFVKILGAGHWLHTEKPREFEAAVRAFLV